ncbi:unnamed protein product [Dicrocoelium dendriticum]|nr:unnamed protein product [Dicrocoelium dendriticum]
MYRDSFLSPSTKRLLFHSFSAHTVIERNGDNFLIDFSELGETVIQFLVDARFAEALIALTPLITSHTSAFRRYSTSELATTFATTLDWLSDPAEFIYLHSRLPCHNATERLLLLLRLTSLFEFSLGRLYWTPTRKCANMMKEVLNSPILEDLCGRNCILLLRLLFGPVTSMNLRNLAWHGFVSPSDMDQVDEAVILFVFILIMSIGQRLTKRAIEAGRPSCITLLESCPVIPDLEILHASTVFLDTTQAHPFAHCSSWAYVRYLDVLLNTHRYLDTLCLSLVCLSILLRHEYAEALEFTDICCSTEFHFFLTLDCILQFNTERVLPYPVTIRHYERFLEQIRDTHVLAILCDLLSAERGPRLKDHLSHGEMWIRRDVKSLESTDAHFKHAALLIYACFLALLYGRVSRALTTTPVSDRLRSYTVLYHPTAIFITNWHYLCANLNKLTGLTGNICAQEVDFSKYPHLSAIIASWFPDQSFVLSIPSTAQLTEELWLILSVWALLSRNPQDLWCCRPTAVLNRLNILIDKFNKCTLLLIDRITFHSDTHLFLSLSARKKASLKMFYNILPCYLTLLAWLRNFLILCWHCWISGFTGNISTRLCLLQQHSHNLPYRAKLIDDLDKAADKLLMWCSKSLWEPLSTFIENLRLVTPRSPVSYPI